MDFGSNRVALFSEEFPPFTFGGISTVAYDLACRLSKQKVSTTVFCGKSAKMTIEKMNDYLEVVRLPCFNYPPRFIWFQLQNFRKILQQLKDPCILHAVNPQMALLCTYLKRKAKGKLVTSYHGVPIYDSKAFLGLPTNSWTMGDFGYNVIEFPINEYLTRVSWANSDQIVACSRVTLNELKYLYGCIDHENSRVIPNGIDFQKIDKIRNDFKEKGNTDDPSLIFVGRLYYTKGLTYLMQAFEYLIQDYPNLKLKIFGGGPLKEKIQSLASKQDFKGKLLVGGQVSRDEVLKEIMKADICVLPSLREAQPMSVLEAMAFKKPLVVFDFPFSREYIRNMNNGILAKPRDSKDLAAKIEVLLCDKNFRDKMGQKAYDFVRQHHNWDSLIKRYIDVYKTLSN